MIGAGVQMFSHGVMTALFFAVVGMVYDQGSYARDSRAWEVCCKVMPLVAVAFIVGGLVSMGMPGFSGFVAEFPDFYGFMECAAGYIVGKLCLDRYPGCHFHCDYSFLYYPDNRKVFFGKMPEEFVDHTHDVSVLDKVALVFLSAILIVLGVYPSIMVPLVESGVNNVLRLLGGA